MTDKKDSLRLSVSKTKTFLDCKKKFKFVYIDKLSRKTWEFHTFGTFCHQVLEDFHNAYIDGVTDPFNVTMSQCFKDSWLKYRADMTPQMKRDCWEIINNYLKKLSKEKFPNVIACEQKFELLVDENIILNGMIDRVQIDDDNVIHVCDYKTVKNKRYIKNDFFQLLTYAYVIIKEDPSVKKVRASYILLRYNFEYITMEFDADEILAVEDKYIDYAKQIIEESEYKPNPTALCSYCDHLERCPEGLKLVSPQLIHGEVSW